jgi:hypothetical protein
MDREHLFRRRVAAVATVLTLLVVLAGLTLTGVQKVRESAARMQCSNNLKQLALGTLSLHDSLGYVLANPDTNSDIFGTLQYHLLPYME